ncbi:MAG: cbb3-type cytochrome c oxidase subunit I [Candidatus Sumerlaeia bacterium]|nr:cbb3-type cytochrome c oxidase subunit I [Candidatus Sumerlaeia bacterium]
MSLLQEPEKKEVVVVPNKPLFPEEPQRPVTKAPGILHILGSTDHKVLGMYLVLALFMGIVGGTFAGAIRAQLTRFGLGAITPEFYNSMMTMHASVMIFSVIIPALVGLWRSKVRTPLH